MGDIRKKIVKSLEDSRILLKSVSEANENDMKERKGGFLGMLFGTVVGTLLENLLANDQAIQAGE